MKIATWNINGVVRRLDNLLAWLDEAAPDVLCLQELKCTQAAFPAAALQEAGYRGHWVAEGRWNGVALLARNFDPVLTRTELPGDADDSQARYIEAAVDGMIVACLYAPNGNPMPGPKYDYKRAWLARLERHAIDLLAQNAPLLLAGDFNIAPEPRDLYETSSYDESALTDAASRAAFRSLLAVGMSDAIRDLFSDRVVYTFWDYRRNRFERNGGLRLDHILLSGTIRARLANGGIDVPTRAKENASDHAPVWVELESDH